MLKWIAGIVGAIIAGVVVWWLVNFVLSPPPGPPDRPDPVVPREFSFTFSPTSARPGEEVHLHLSDSLPVMVYFQGRPLPKKVLSGGRTLVVTVPGDTKNDGYFELEHEGRRFPAKEPLIIELASDEPAVHRAPPASGEPTRHRSPPP